jgi:hypothetical protein
MPELLIELPEPLAAEALRELDARRVLRVRHATVDEVVMILGVGGSLVSLIQTPTSLRDFAAWLTRTAGKRDDTKLLEVRRKSDNGVVIEVAKGMDPDAVAEILKQAMKPS